MKGKRKLEFPEGHSLPSGMSYPTPYPYLKDRGGCNGERRGGRVLYICDEEGEKERAEGGEEEEKERKRGVRERGGGRNEREWGKEERHVFVLCRLYGALVLECLAGVRRRRGGGEGE